MVIFTDEQVDATLKRLNRIDEIFDGMCEIVGNLADEKRSLEREVERLKNRLKSTEEELAMAQKALVSSAEIIDEKNRQVERLAVTINDYANEVIKLRDILGMLRTNLKVSGSNWELWHTEVALGYIDFALND